jgi:RIO kinase 1
MTPRVSRPRIVIKTPKRLLPLVEEGLVDEVVRQLMSGKEATVYVVRCGQEVRCAKVYKEPDKRSFRKAVQYTQGRRVKNSRRSRAMEKGTRYGREQLEAAWQYAEVSALQRLAKAGVRVPRTYNCLDGVLLMDLVTDAQGNAAPRLNDLELSPEQAREFHAALLADVVKMLCAGIVHGDLSEYNVLVDSQGPVIIDLPQAVDASGNIGAGPMLERDVENLTAFFGRFAPELRATDYGKEIWALYESAELVPGVVLTGRFERVEKPVDLQGVMYEIDDVKKEEAARQLYLQSLER